MPKEEKSFWSSVPGILTAFGGVIAAIASLIGALYSAGIVGGPRGQSSETALARSEPVKPPPGEAIALRSAPAIVSDAQLDALLGTRGFYEKARNPGGAGVAHRYETRVVGDASVVVDHATRLMWQKGGSQPMTPSDTGGYIASLNTRRFAGFDDWRLPTAEEAMSLMEPRPADDGLHLATAFQRGVNFIWAGDKRPDGRAWVVYFFDGIIQPEQPTFNAWVRAVRTFAE